MSPNVVALLYLVSGVLFILALRGLSSPESSRRGNFYGMAGMAIAIAIPAIPKRLPRRELSGLDRPRSARMKKTPETR